MKVKHRNLEQVRKAPETAAQLSLEKSAGGKTMVRVWDRSIGHYHEKNDAEYALNYLDTGLLGFSDTKEHKNRRETYRTKLKNYIEGYEKLDFKNVKTMSHLKLDIHHNNFITGEIFRIDMTPDAGYAITLLNRTDEIWTHELRFRLLQIYCSNVYKCPYDSVKVGVFNFEKEKHEYVSFDDIELKQAWAEIISISNKINEFRF